MGFQILKFLVAIFVYSRLAHQQDTPEDRCQRMNEAGITTGTVCLDCSHAATCENGVIGTIFSCPTNVQTYCDDTIGSTCASIPASITNCSCASISQCIADPNNPAVVLHCESNKASDPPCSASEIIDLTTCGCTTCSGDCPLLDDPNDDCASYFACNGTALIPASCLGGSCFNQELCGCAEGGGSTTTTITPNPDCPFIDDPNSADDCSKFFYYDGTTLLPVQCVDGQCFNQALCTCIDQDATTTPVPNCIFLDDPTDECSSYFIDNGTALIPVSCVDPFCFDQASCGCIDTGRSTTTTTSTTTAGPTVTTVTPTTTTTATTTTATSTTTPIGTCPSSGCPFLDDPNDPCGRFYICDEGVVVLASQCPGILCFDQATCQCT